MPAQLVPTVQTKYSQVDLIKELTKGWIRLFGVVPDKKQIGVLWSQNALETGLTAAMWCNNIGNVKYVAKATDTEAIKYCQLRNVWEIINGKKVIFQPPHPATWFRAFDTIELGVDFFLNVLTKRFGQSWIAVQNGDPALFAKLLRQQGYYTAPEADYRAAMLKYFNSFMASKDFENAMLKINTVPAPPPEAPPVVVNPTPVPSEPLPPEPMPAPTPIATPVPEKPTGVAGIFHVIKGVLSAFKRN